MASVKVAVRARPLSQREMDMQSRIIVNMQENKTSILNTKLPSNIAELSEVGRERVKEFTYDYSYWSCKPSDPHFTSQEQVFEDLGRGVVDNAFEGYNSCIFAYGQTGSGKTYTMMGTPESEGLIPRICQALFKRMKGKNSGTTFRTEVSYLEIYNERVKDLLAVGSQPNLKVREHPKLGPYVQDLSHHYVMDYNDVRDFMTRGNVLRTTATTAMNDASSRSHAIFRLTFTQAKLEGDMPSETVSKINLVDLAGSERADATGATGIRLKEGGHINKSLVTLGNVISALADLTCNPKRTVFIPYRDSVLTWLLKDSLGGNSKTVMIATISPAECNYGESLSTLRYASRAKNIINRPTINEDSNVKLIRELREEIAYLRSLLNNHNSDHESPKIIEKLEINEARVKVLTEEWAEKWKDIQKILEEQRTLNLRKASSGVVLDSAQPHLIGLDGDVLSTGITLYHLKEGRTTVGTYDAETKQDIELSGEGIDKEHCLIELKEGVTTLIPLGQAQCLVNTIPIDAPTRLSQGCVILLGSTNMFRFNDPQEVERLRKNMDFAPAVSRSKLSLLSRSVSAMSLDISHHSSNQFKEYPDPSRRQSFQTLKREALLRKGRSQEELCNIVDRKMHLTILREEISRMQEEAKQIESDELNQERQPGVGSEPENYEATMILSSESTTIDEEKENATVDGKVSKDERNKNVKLTKLEEKEEDVISRCNSWLDQGISSINATDQRMSKSATFSPNMEPIGPEFEVKRRNLKYLTDNINRRRSDSDFNEDYRRKSFSTSSFFSNDYRDNILPCCEEDNVHIWNAKTVKNLETQIMQNMKNVALSPENPEAIDRRLKEMKDLEKKFMEIEAEMELRRLHLEQTEAGTLSPASSCVGMNGGIPVLQEEEDQKTRLSFLVELEVQRRIQEELAIMSLSPEGSPQSKNSLCQRTRSFSQPPLNTWKSQESFNKTKSTTTIDSRSLNRSKSVDCASSLLNGCGCRVTIPSYTIRGSGAAKHYEYEVKIQTVDDQWSIFRRYKRFRELHHYMKQKFGKDVILPYFPPKKLFGSCSDKVVKERRKYLELYLQELVIILGMQSPKSNYNVMIGGLKKQELCRFSQFFQKGCYELTKHGTG